MRWHIDRWNSIIPLQLKLFRGCIRRGFVHIWIGVRWNEVLGSFVKGKLGGAWGRHFGLSLHYSMRGFLCGEALTRNYLVARQQTSSCLTLQQKVQHPFIQKAWALLSQYHTLLMTWVMRWCGEGAKGNWGAKGKDEKWKFHLDQFKPSVFICVSQANNKLQ